MPFSQLGPFSAKKLFFTLLGLGGTWYCWLHRDSILSFVQKLISGGGFDGGGNVKTYSGAGRKLGGSLYPIDDGDGSGNNIRSRIDVINAVEESSEGSEQMSDAGRLLREAREARLRRFETMNQQQKQKQEEDLSSSDVG